MHLINAQYRILDVFEKNPFQSLMLGAAVDKSEEIAVINEIIWSPLFTQELAESLMKGFINLKNHSEDATSCQLVTAYHKGMPISNYLSTRSLPFSNRINLCYGLLKTLVAYNEFPPWIQDILIDQDQIIVWEDQLLFNELLILKTEDPAYGDTIHFSKVQKKIHRLLKKLLDNPSPLAANDAEKASPVLLDFLNRLRDHGDDMSSLQIIYDEFQKVYLYDYYLDQQDHNQVSPGHPSVLIPLPLEVEANQQAEPPEESDEEPEPLSQISEGPASPVASDLEHPALIPVLPFPDEEALAIDPPSEPDEIDSDMERNLELFFNRDRKLSEFPEEKEKPDRKNMNWFWIALGVVGLLLTIWAAAQLLIPGGKPIAAFTSLEKDGIWTLQNKSTFSSTTRCQRSEWTVLQNGKVIDLYDTFDLTLSLEEEGTYQIVLRVMDSDGQWSKPTKAALENHLDAAAPEIPPTAVSTPDVSLAGNEKMDQFTIKSNPDRTRKDPDLFRTGSYSLQISPGKDPEIIEVQGIMLDKNGMVSLWMASDNTKSISLIFTGYNQSTQVFSKEVTYKPLAPQQWEMRQFTVEAKQLVNRMTISIKADAQINIDDLTIESFK